MCADLTGITHNKDFAGFVKNIAWEYEKETRLLVELPAGLAQYPDRIAIGCKNIWNSVNILCGPCLERTRVIQEIQNLYNTSKGKNILRIPLDDKHIVDSKNLWLAHFKHKCENCKIYEWGKCSLQKNI